MDDQRDRDEAQRELERIREALGQERLDPAETLPLTGPESDQHRSLPELPREEPADRFLEGFSEGRSLPAKEAALEATQVLADLPMPRRDRSEPPPPPERPTQPPTRPAARSRELPPTRPAGGPHRRSPTRGGWHQILLVSIATGLLIFSSLFVFSLVSYRGVEYMGVSSDDLAGTIVGMFRDTIILAQVEALGLHLALGLANGLVAGALLVVFGGLRERPVSLLSALLLSAGIAALAHLLVLAHAMALQPQIFSDAWYGHGGLPRAVQVAFSDWWPVWATPLVGILVLLFVSIGGALIIARDRVGPGRLLAALPLGSAALLLVLALWPSSPTIPRSSHERLNLVILSADSLRADALAQASMGGLARMVDEGMVFEDGWTAMPRTLPAWVSFVTGQRPFRHGIRHMFPTPTEMAAVDRTAIHTLRDAGYQTGVFSDFAGDVFTRMDLGFETVSAPSFSLDDTTRLGSWKPHLHLVAWLRTLGAQELIPNVGAWERMPLANEITDDALAWLSTRDPSEPFMMTIFWSTTHFPFAAPHPYSRSHATPDYEGPNRYLKTDMAGTADDMEIQRVRDLYRAGVDAVDLEVARVLEALEEAGLLENTVVLLLADHGENLYEQDFGVTHGDHLYGQASHRIPFIVRLPGGEGGLGGRTARGIDVAPTLLGLAGLPTGDRMEGVALFDGPARPGEEAPAVVPAPGPIPVYSETGLVFSRFDTGRLKDAHLRFEDSLHIFDVDAQQRWTIFLQPSYNRDFLMAKHRMWLRWPHKLLYIPTRQGPRWELFDLEQDPGEIHNLFSEEDPLSRGLRDELVELLSRAGDASLVNGYLVPR